MEREGKVRGEKIATLLFVLLWMLGGGEQNRAVDEDEQ
jgi:hypothetical protein